jgi:hypothetical protein
MFQDISCNYFESKKNWQIRVSPVFIDISCQDKDIQISLDVSTDTENSIIDYEYTTGYKSGMYISEVVFTVKNIKLVIGAGQYADHEATPYGYIHFECGDVLSKMRIPFEVSRIVFGIINNLSKEVLEEFGATEIVDFS